MVSTASANLDLELMEKVVEFGGVGKTAAIPGYESPVRLALQS